MSSALAGLEHYTPASEPVEPPAWMLTEEKVWARIHDECRPVAIEKREAEWRLEVPTCKEGETTCSVTVRSDDEGTAANAFCGAAGVSAGPVFGDQLRLVSADEVHVAYLRVVELQIVPVGLRGEFQRCTRASLRELERRAERVESPPAVEPDVQDLSLEPTIVMGNRACLFADGFEVKQASRPDATWVELPDSWNIASVPGRHDCLQPCASNVQLQELVDHAATIVGRQFLPPRPRGLDLFRTQDACAAAADLPPSVLGKDLGPARFGMCLPEDGLDQ